MSELARKREELRLLRKRVELKRLREQVAAQRQHLSQRDIPQRAVDFGKGMVGLGTQALGQGTGLLAAPAAAAVGGATGGLPGAAEAVRGTMRATSDLTNVFPRETREVVGMAGDLVGSTPLGRRAINFAGDVIEQFQEGTDIAGEADPLAGAALSVAPTMLNLATATVGGKQFLKSLVDHERMAKKSFMGRGEFRKTLNDMDLTGDALLDEARKVITPLEEAITPYKPAAKLQLNAKVRTRLLAPRVDPAKRGLQKELRAKRALSDPEVAKAVNSLTQGNMSPKKLFDIRQSLRANPTDEADELRTIIDDFLANTKPSMVTGNVPDVNFGEAMSVWRQLYRRGQRTKAVEEVLQDAMASGFHDPNRGILNALRTLIKKKSNKRLWTDSERAAISKAIDGGNVRDMVSVLGRFSISPDRVFVPLAGWLTGGAAGLNAPVIGAVQGIAQAAKPLANRLVRRDARFAKDVIAAGTDAEDIVRAYKRHTPRGQWKASELKRLLVRRDVNIDDMMTDDRLAIRSAQLALLERQSAELAVPLSGVVPALEEHSP